MALVHRKPEEDEFPELLNILLIAYLPAFFFIVWLLPLLLEISLLIALSLFLIRYGNQPHASPEPSFSWQYPFKTENTEYALKFNTLQGASFAAILEVVLKHWRCIDWRTYGHRVLALLCMGVLNSIFSLVDTVIFGHRFLRQKLNDSPVFILGHPRTGTTLLHNLLSLDTDNFIFTSTFQAGFPHGNLLLNDHTDLFKSSLAEKRPMDNMALGFQTPQEDEVGINALTAGISPYMPLAMMTIEPEYRPYFSFESARAAERNRWVESLLYLLRKVTFCHDPECKRRMVLKSPVHTARVKLLRQLFPKAQFVYIHRDPYRVFESAANMAQKTYTYNYLTSPSPARIQDFILNQYVTLFNEYIAARDELPPGTIHETSFDSLTADMVGTIEKIYKHFGWGGWDRMKPKLEAYSKGQKKFKKNDFKSMDQAAKDLVYKHWKSSFDEFGYKR